MQLIWPQSRGKSYFLFHIVLLDATYWNYTLVRAYVWDIGAIWGIFLWLNGKSWMSTCRLKGMMKFSRRLQRWSSLFSVKVFELKVLHAPPIMCKQGFTKTFPPPMHFWTPIFLDGRTHTKNHGESYQKKKLAKKLLANFILALSKANLLD